MDVLDEETFPKPSLDVKTDGHKDDVFVRLKATGCHVFVLRAERRVCCCITLPGFYLFLTKCQCG